MNKATFWSLCFAHDRINTHHTFISDCCDAKLQMKSSPGNTVILSSTWWTGRLRFSIEKRRLSQFHTSEQLSSPSYNHISSQKWGYVRRPLILQCEVKSEVNLQGAFHLQSMPFKWNPSDSASSLHCSLLPPCGLHVKSNPTGRGKSLWREGKIKN